MLTSAEVELSWFKHIVLLSELEVRTSASIHKPLPCLLSHFSNAFYTDTPLFSMLQHNFAFNKHVFRPRGEHSNRARAQTPSVNQ
jgi:hypothetical protein